VVFGYFVCHVGKMCEYGGTGREIRRRGQREDVREKEVFNKAAKFVDQKVVGAP
jgi:hypothetical protein